MQLESVVGEDDKAYIKRLWKKREEPVDSLRKAQIDKRDTDTDTDTEHGECEDKEEDSIAKDKKRIKQPKKNLKKEETIILNVFIKKRLKA